MIILNEPHRLFIAYIVKIIQKRGLNKMFCTSCGNQIPDGSTVCPVCGNFFDINLETQGMGYQSNQTTQMNASNMGYQGGQTMQVETQNMGYQNQPMSNQSGFVNMIQKPQTITQNKQMQPRPNKVDEERTIKKVEELFVNEDEEQVAVLGGSYLQNMLHGGGLSKGFGVLTDKRYYFKGRCYTKQAGHFVKTDEEWCVDVKDITATGFIYKGRILLLLLAIACLGFGIYGSACEADAIYFVVGFLLAGVLLFAYFCSKKGMYIVAFAGGSIGLDVSKYGGTKAVKAFDKKMRKAKDKAIGGVNDDL